MPGHEETYVCTKQRRQLYAYRITSKRYALFNLSEGGEVALRGLADGDDTEEDNLADDDALDELGVRKYSQRGLDAYEAPCDPACGKPVEKWQQEVWCYLITRAPGYPVDLPAWAQQTALTKVRIGTPEQLRWFDSFNRTAKGTEKSYVDQVKPFNFLLTAHVARFGHPDGVDPTHFQLIAPYEKDPSKWTQLPWTDRYSGQQYRVTTEGVTGGAGVARVQTYRDVLEDFLYHPEAKSAGPDGKPCDRQTVGLLQRRVVRSIPEMTTHVGKEANRLEEVEAGIAHDPDEVWTEYSDPNRDPWATLVVPVLKQMKAQELVAATGLALSTVKAARNGHAKPHPKNQRAFITAAGAYARERLKDRGTVSPANDLTACASYLLQNAPQSTDRAAAL